MYNFTMMRRPSPVLHLKDLLVELVYVPSMKYTSKHNTFTQCWFDVEPASQTDVKPTLGQRLVLIVSIHHSAHV